MRPPRKPASDGRAVLRTAFLFATLALVVLPGDPPGIVLRKFGERQAGLLWHAVNLETSYETWFYASPDFSPRRADVLRWEAEDGEPPSRDVFGCSDKLAGAQPSAP